MKIQIVDSLDTLITTKERESIDHANDIYRVTALWLTNSKGESLLAKRAMTKKNSPGKWGPAVAGTVEEGETYESNIYKEAAEEIGLTGVPFQLSKKVEVHENSTGRHFFCQWFTVTVDLPIESFTRQVSEVDELKWMNTEAFKRDLFENPETYLPSASQTIEDLNL